MLLGSLGSAIATGSDGQHSAGPERSPHAKPFEARYTDGMHMLTNGSFTVTFVGWERSATLRSEVSVPRERIQSMEFHQDYLDPGGVWRSGGTGLPRVLYAGRFRRRGEREVWFLRGARGLRHVRARNVLEVITDQPDARRLLLTCEPAEAERILAWYRAG